MTRIDETWNPRTALEQLVHQCAETLIGIGDSRSQVIKSLGEPPDWALGLDSLMDLWRYDSLEVCILKKTDSVLSITIIVVAERDEGLPNGPVRDLQQQFAATRIGHAEYVASGLRAVPVLCFDDQAVFELDIGTINAQIVVGEDRVDRISFGDTM